MKKPLFLAAAIPFIMACNSPTKHRAEQTVSTATWIADDVSGKIWRVTVIK